MHYLHFSLSGSEVAAAAAGPVALAIDHPDYRHSTELTDETRQELLIDLHP